jgi:hypothetical protein
VNTYTQRTSGLLVAADVDLGKPRVVHCKRERHHAYIGRPSKWGNPFIVGKHAPRGECIGLFEDWLRENDRLFAALDELAGLVLGCWCAPRACHGEPLCALANTSQSERERWRGGADWRTLRRAA